MKTCVSFIFHTQININCKKCTVAYIRWPVCDMYLSSFITGEIRMLAVITGKFRMLTVITGDFRMLEVITGDFRMLCITVAILIFFLYSR